MIHLPTFFVALTALAGEPPAPLGDQTTELPPGFGVEETPLPAPRVASYALFVGVNEPARLSAGLEPLRHAETDALAMAALMGSSAEATRYDQVVVLIGAEATRLNVQAELDRAVSELEPGARVLVYFASHGGMTSAESGQGRRRYLLLADGDATQLAATGLDVQDMHERLIKGAPSAQIVEIYDACATVETPDDSRERGRASSRRAVPALVPGVGDTPRVQLFAASDGEGTREYDSLASGLYTHYLTEALQGAADRDGDRDGRVTAGEAHAYVKVRMGDRSTPVVRSEERTFGASAQVPLRELERPLYVARTLPEDALCVGCVVETTLSPLGKGAAPVQPGAIEPGLYRLQVTRRSTATDETKELGPPLGGLTVVGPREVLDPLERLDPSAAPPSRPIWVEVGVMRDLDGDPKLFTGLRPATMPQLGLSWSGRGLIAPMVGLSASAGPNVWAAEKRITVDGEAMNYTLPGVDMMAMARLGVQMRRPHLSLGAQAVASDTMHWFLVPNERPEAMFERGLFGPDFNPGLGVGARAQVFTGVWAFTVEQSFLWEWSYLGNELTLLTPLGVSAITTFTVGRKIDVF